MLVVDPVDDPVRTTSGAVPILERRTKLPADSVCIAQQRTDDEVMPPRVEYSLTVAGGELNAAVHTLAQWGDRHAVERIDPPGNCVR